MRWEFRITTVDQGDAVRIAAAGRLSAAATPRLADAIGAAIAAGRRRILLDLKDLDYISSVGLMAIEAAAARLRTDGGWLRLEGAQPAVQVALDLGLGGDALR